MHSLRRQFNSLHFDGIRTKETKGNVSGLLEGAIISLTMPASSTDFESLAEIARLSSNPFQIKCLSEQLKEKHYVRGRVFFGHVGDEIEKILSDYPNLRWWLEKDGLVVAEPSSELGPLSDFDRIAGSLYIEHMKDGKLSASSIEIIAVKLDAEGFQLSQILQTAQWRAIRDHNQKYSKRAIKTFAECVRNPKFVRNVRRRLYVARDRYNKASQPIKPIFTEI